MLNVISNQKKPVSASFLAKELNVSRQVIVGDIALLRDGEHEIIVTTRGYMIQRFNNEAGGSNILKGEYIGIITPIAISKPVIVSFIVFCVFIKLPYNLHIS